MDELKAYVYCPECGHEITVIEKVYSRYDYKCPNCYKKKFSEFETKTILIKSE